MNEIRYFTVVDILWLHFRIVEDYGGAHGVRDENRLKSVVVAPRQVVFGQDQYGTIYEKAAVYARNIIGDHPFVDGNKRTGITVCLMFLRRNGVELSVSAQALEDFAVSIAADQLSVVDIAAWLQNNG